MITTSTFSIAQERAGRNLEPFDDLDACYFGGAPHLRSLRSAYLPFDLDVFQFSILADVHFIIEFKEGLVLVDLGLYTYILLCGSDGGC